MGSCVRGSMESRPEVLFSYRYDVLIEGLKKNLFHPSQKFCRKWVVIPTDWLKDFLLKEFSSDPSLQVATGLRFLNLNLCVKDVMTLLGDRNREMKFPRREGLSFFIEREWTSLRQDYPLLDQYLSAHPHRGIELADTMAHLMMKRTLHAKDGVEFVYDWQYDLEKKIFEEYDCPEQILQQLQVPIQSEVEIELHLFGFHDMPALYIDFFEKLATRFPIFFYNFSPTSHYWGDVLSEKASLYLERKLALSGKAAEAAAPYFVVSNSLLAEGVEVAKPLLHEMIDLGFFLEEEMPLIEDSTALGQLQKDLFEMETSKREKGDDSLQLHAAPSLLREVQVVRMLIEQLALEKGAFAKDMRVYVTSMGRYAPYIEYVFGDPRSLFGFICDNTPQAQSALFEAFISLLNAPQKLMLPEEVFSILKCKAVLQKWDLTTKDYDELLDWVLSAKIDFGFDGSQRKEIHVDLNERGSWLYTINQWTISLAFTKEGDPPSPSFEIGHFFPFAKASLLQSLLMFINELKRFYEIVVESPQRTLLEWTQLIEDLLPRFFAIDEREDEYFQLEMLKNALQSLRHLEGELTQMEVGYESIRKRLVDILSTKETRKFSQDDKEKISFLGIKKGQIVSADYLFIMGFDEESFPSQDEPLSLIRLTKPSQRALFLSSRQDLCLFLQLLFQAKRSLIFTYCEQTEDPESSYVPSLCYSLLKDYAPIELTHSLYDFSPNYFTENSPVKNYSLLDYEIAKSLYEDKGSLACDFTTSVQALEEKEDLLLKDLKSFASHPIRYFINHRLRIYLEKEEDLEMPGVVFSYLDRHQFLNEGLERGKNETLRKWELSGRLPYGIFEEVALLEIEEDLDKSFNLMKQILNEEVFQLEIDPRHFQKKKQEPHVWVHPPISLFVEGKKKRIHGVIKRVSEKRLYTFHEQDLESLVKIWPEILIFKICFPSAEEVVFLKDQTILDIRDLEAEMLLNEYIAYFNVYSEKPSWLVPKWAKKIFTDDDFASNILKNQDESKSLFPDPYLEWFFMHYPLAQDEQHIKGEQSSLKSHLEALKELCYANL